VFRRIDIVENIVRRHRKTKPMQCKTIALSVGVVASLATTAALAWAPTPEAQANLLKGEPWAEVLADSEGAGLIHAAIDIAAPPKTVWAVMTDCKLAPRLVTTVTLCRITQGDQQRGWDVREQVTRGNFFVPTIRNVVREEFQPFSLIRFHRVGGDLQIEEGEWRLLAMNGGAGTRVIYVNRVKADIMAPPPLVRLGMRKDTSKVLLNLRRESLDAARK
jgi:hypothetical protein